MNLCKQIATANSDHMIIKASTSKAKRSMETSREDFQVNEHN